MPPVISQKGPKLKNSSFKNTTIVSNKPEG
jgi:hypothetical protein